MRSLKLSLALGTTVLALALPGAALAASDQHLTFGTPGTPNCFGQTEALVAQAFQNGLTTKPSHNGIGNLAAANGIPASQIQDEIRAACGNP